MNFNRFKEKLRAERVRAAWPLIVAIGLLALIAFVPWIGYWIYYKPLYTVFENSFYLPFYVYAAGSVIVYCVLLAGAVACFRSFCNKKISWEIVIIIGFLVLAFFLVGKNIYKDVAFMNASKYTTAECDLDTLKVYYHNTGRFAVKYYGIKTAERATANGRELIIEMDFYQYNELLKKKKENRDRAIMVFYLPNTKKMLNYQYEAGTIRGD
jgi:hypothetical protein